VLPVDAVAGIPVEYTDAIIRKPWASSPPTASTDEVLACWS